MSRVTKTPFAGSQRHGTGTRKQLVQPGPVIKPASDLPMKAYLSLLKHVLDNGELRQDRTGTGTLSVFAPPPFRHDMREGFPLLTTKKVSFKSVAIELMWFLRGRTDVKWLQERGVTIWNEWQLQDGSIGAGYGYQWREWDAGDVDQIAALVEGLKNDPFSRRNIVTAWNPSELPYMALPPCHCFFQCYVGGDQFLDLQLYQRSADLFLGVPFNIASYALLMKILGHCTGLTPRHLTISFGDAHIYQNHMEPVRTQLSRDPMPLPAVAIDALAPTIPWEIEFEHLALIDYNRHPAIKAQVAV